MGRLKTYFMAVRPQFLPAVMVAVGLGTTTAWYTHRAFDLTYFIVTSIAALLYHAGMNVLNDYFDYLNGTDNINKRPLTPFAGGSRMIQSGLMTGGETLMLASILLAAGTVAGLYLVMERGPVLLVIGLMGLLTGVFYSAPPLFLAARGLGEVTVGLDFGILATLGACFVQTGGLEPEAVASSLPITFLIAALLYINQFPDYEADKAAGKRNLVVRLGPERARWGMIVIVALAYLSIIAGAAAGLLPLLSLSALVTLVFSAPAVAGLFKNYLNGPALIPSIKRIILSHLSTGLLVMASQLIQSGVTAP